MFHYQILRFIDFDFAKNLHNYHYYRYFLLDRLESFGKRETLSHVFSSLFGLSLKYCFPFRHETLIGAPWLAFQIRVFQPHSSDFSTLNQSNRLTLLHSDVAISSS